MSINRDKVKPLLIGIVLDVSSSMRRNWKNEEGEEVPKITAIRDTLNNLVKRISLIHGSQKRRRAIDVFCLGMGFRKTDFVSQLEITRGYEKAVEGEPKKQTRADIVCDILALNELIPTKEELEQIKVELNKKWNIYARKSLDRAHIDDDIYEQLRLYIQTHLHDSAQSKLRRSLIYKVHNRIKGSKIGDFKYSQYILRLLSDRIRYWDKKINENSYKESIRFFNSVQDKYRKIFDQNKNNYVKFINDTLQNFVDIQTNEFLTLMTIGYEKNSLLEYFDETKAYELAKKIYNYLYQEVTSSMVLTWTQNKTLLAITRKDLRARIDYGEVKILTEKCIQKYGWSILNPFVEQIVFDMFANSFEEAAKEKINYWIEFSSKREIIRPIKQVVNILPETFSDSMYTETYMFGSTPIIDAIHRTTARILDKSYKNKEKIVVIISDGEFENNFSLHYTELLKKSGVIVVSCYVANKNIIRNLVIKSLPNWPKGAKMLFEAASLSNSDDLLAKRLEQYSYKIPEGHKLFFQINESGTLSEILELLMNIQS